MSETNETEDSWDQGDAGGDSEIAPNILNRIAQAIVDQQLDAGEKEDRELALGSAALLCRKAGAQVDKPSVPDVLALALAGETLAKERTAWLVQCLQSPGLSMKPFDGGRALEAGVLAEFQRLLSEGSS